MLPHEPAALRIAVRASLDKVLARSISPQELVRVIEMIAADSRAAGIRASLVLLDQAKMKAEDKTTPSTYLAQYIEGYNRALEDASELLNLESSG